MSNFLISSAALLVLGLVLIIIALVLLIITYYMISTGLYRLSKKNELPNAWFAYIPIIQIYIAVKNIDEIRIFGFRIPKLEILLPVSALLSNLQFLQVRSLSASYSIIQSKTANALGNFYAPIIWTGKISSIISSILMCIVIYYIYKMYSRPSSFKKMIIISIITLGMAIPLYIYRIGKEQYKINTQKNNLTKVTLGIYIFVAFVTFSVGCTYFIIYRSMQPQLKAIQEARDKLAQVINEELGNPKTQEELQQKLNEMINEQKEKKEKFIDAITNFKLVVQNDIPMRIYPSSRYLTEGYYTIKENENKNAQGISFNFKYSSYSEEQHLTLSYVLENVGYRVKRFIRGDIKVYDKNNVLVQETTDKILEYDKVEPGQKSESLLFVNIKPNPEIKEIHFRIY